MEAGRLAETTGIDLAKLRAALLMSSGASDALKEWDMISFTWALKDMQIVADLTDKAGLSLPVTGTIKELVKDARRIKGDQRAEMDRTRPAGAQRRVSRAIQSVVPNTLCGPAACAQRRLHMRRHRRADADRRAVLVEQHHDLARVQVKAAAATRGAPP